MRKYVLLLILIFNLTAYAEENVYNLEIDMTEDRETAENVITKEEMKRDNARDLWKAVRYTPGIILSGGGQRNDSAFTVRGFGADSVPIFVDGVIIANPYRGEGDAARILTGDLESIAIQKGYSSMLLGANTLGGAVLMTTAKPKKKLEAEFETSFETDSIFKHSANYYLASVGTKQDKFYLKGTWQFRDVDHFRMSDDFQYVKKNPQTKGERLFSDSTDSKTTLIAGVTPSDSLDIWATYTYQEADKGVSPPETRIQGISIWDWPIWKRESVALASSYDSGRFSLDTLFHYDEYNNRLNEYYNMASYKYGVHLPSSDYDEHTAGARIAAGWRFNRHNRIQLAGTFKREQHTGLKKEQKEISIKEDTVSVGAEYTWIPADKLTLVGGLGYDSLIPKSYWGKSDEFAQFIGADDFVVKTKQQWLVTGQLGAFYEFMKDQELRLTYARKNHFPTMAQRYSTRFGTELPNPQLAPEVADHYEFGYKGGFEKVSLNSALYYSKLQDKIVTIEIPDPSQPTSVVDFSLNLDEVTYYGFEQGLEVHFNKYLAGGGAFSYNKYDINKSADKTTKAINYYPERTASGYLMVMPTEKLTLMPRAEYVGSRYADTEGAERLDGYTLWHFKVTEELNRYFSVSASVNNIFDRYYEIMQFYPMPGRTYLLTLTAKY